jgi:arginine exporter protein ArgO
MRPVTISQTGIGNSAVVIPDYMLNPFNIGVAVKVTGTVTYTVEHTFDDVFATTFNPATATWFPHTTLAAQTASAVSNYAFAVRGIRVTVTAGTGTAALTLVQSGVASN